MREREGLFNEYLIEVRKREKEEKSHRREQVCACKTFQQSLITSKIAGVFACIVTIVYQNTKTRFY